MVPVVLRPRVVAVYHPRVHQSLSNDSTNHGAVKRRGEPTIETLHVGVSTETADRHEKKPELKIQFRPITAKQRAKNSKISLRGHLSADISQTVHPRHYLIGSAPTKLALLHPMVIQHDKFAPPVTALCK